ESPAATTVGESAGVMRLPAAAGPEQEAAAEDEGGNGQERQPAGRRDARTGPVGPSRGRRRRRSPGGADGRVRPAGGPGQGVGQALELVGLPVLERRPPGG